MKRVPLNEVAPAEQPNGDVSGDVWEVGLEHVEPHTGRLLERATTHADDLGPSKVMFDERNVLYSKLRPYLNKVLLPDGFGVATSELVPLRPDPERLDRRYLGHYLRSPGFVAFAVSRTAGANLPRLSMQALRAHKVPLPSLDEQREIASILDRADASRAKQRRALARLDALLAAVFDEMFGDPLLNEKGWPEVKLGDMSAIFSDGPFGSKLKSSHYVDEGVRVIRLQNIGVGQFVDDDKAYVTQEHFNSLRKHRCLPGDVLIGTLGTPNLRACVQPDAVPVALNKADCVQMRPDPKRATSGYACWLLNMPATLAKASGLIHGQTRSRISMGKLRELALPLPPLALQHEFETRIAAVSQTRHRFEAQGARLDALYAALAARAFRGELALAPPAA